MKAPLQYHLLGGPLGDSVRPCALELGDQPPATLTRPVHIVQIEYLDHHTVTAPTKLTGPAARLIEQTAVYRYTHTTDTAHVYSFEAIAEETVKNPVPQP